MKKLILAMLVAVGGLASAQQTNTTSSLPTGPIGQYIRGTQVRLAPSVFYQGDIVLQEAFDRLGTRLAGFDDDIEGLSSGLSGVEAAPVVITKGMETAGGAVENSGNTNYVIRFPAPLGGSGGTNGLAGLSLVENHTRYEYSEANGLGTLKVPHVPKVSDDWGDYFMLTTTAGSTGWRSSDEKYNVFISARYEDGDMHSGLNPVLSGFVMKSGGGNTALEIARSRLQASEDRADGDTSYTITMFVPKGYSYLVRVLNYNTDTGRLLVYRTRSRDTW